MSPVSSHARLGASKAERWINCRGSVTLIEDLERAGLVEDTSSPYADEGTAAHDLLETALSKDLHPSTWVGSSNPVKNKQTGEVKMWEITPEMASAVSVAWDYVRGVRESLGDAQMMLEHKFSLGALNPPEPMFGTSDVTLWSPSSRELHVLDYKHGAGVAVDVVGNYQLRYYVLGAVLEMRKRPSKVVMHIMQPRAHHQDGGCRRWEITWEDLVEFRKLLMSAAEDAVSGSGDLEVGDWCKWCLAKPRCPAQKALAEEVAQAEFAVIPHDETGPRVLPHPHTLTDEELVFILDRADVVEGWLKAVRQHVHSALEAGETLPGYRLAPKRANRKWSDEAAAEEALEPLGEARYTKKLVSPAQAEKELKRIKMKLPEDLVVKESSGTNLVRDDSPRAVALPPAQTEFELAAGSVDPTAKTED